MRQSFRLVACSALVLAATVLPPSQALSQSEGASDEAVWAIAVRSILQDASSHARFLLAVDGKAPTHAFVRLFAKDSRIAVATAGDWPVVEGGHTSAFGTRGAVILNITATRWRRPADVEVDVERVEGCLRKSREDPGLLLGSRSTFRLHRARSQWRIVEVLAALDPACGWAEP